MLYKSKNRTFNYKPRFSKENNRETNDDSLSEEDFISKWKGVHGQNKKTKTVLPISVLILLLVLLLIGIYVLDSYVE